MIRATESDRPACPVEVPRASLADAEEPAAQDGLPLEHPDEASEAGWGAAYEAWARESEELRQVDQEAFQKALDVIEAESKQYVRREWGLD